MPQVFILNMFSDLFCDYIHLLSVFYFFLFFCIHIHAAGLRTESVLIILVFVSSFLLSIFLASVLSNSMFSVFMGQQIHYFTK